MITLLTMAALLAYADAEAEREVELQPPRVVEVGCLQARVTGLAVIGIEANPTELHAVRVGHARGRRARAETLETRVAVVDRVALVAPRPRGCDHQALGAVRDRSAREERVGARRHLTRQGARRPSRIWARIDAWPSILASVARGGRVTVASVRRTGVLRLGRGAAARSDQCDQEGESLHLAIVRTRGRKGNCAEG